MGGNERLGWRKRTFPFNLVPKNGNAAEYSDPGMVEMLISEGRKKKRKKPAYLFRIFLSNIGLRKPLAGHIFNL